MKQVLLITDGACKGNPGPGGWACVLRYGGHHKEIWGSEPRTTNNRMELTAAVRGLQVLKEICSVEIVTDSEYVKNGITSWITNWKRNGWKTSAKKPVVNQDLWEELDRNESAPPAYVGLIRSAARPDAFLIRDGHHSLARGASTPNVCMAARFSAAAHEMVRPRSHLTLRFAEDRQVQAPSDGKQAQRHHHDHSDGKGWCTR